MCNHGGDGFDRTGLVLRTASDDACCGSSLLQAGKNHHGQRKKSTRLQNLSCAAHQGRGKEHASLGRCQPKRGRRTECCPHMGIRKAASQSGKSRQKIRSISWHTCCEQKTSRQAKLYRVQNGSPKCHDGAAGSEKASVCRTSWAEQVLAVFPAGGKVLCRPVWRPVVLGVHHWALGRHSSLQHAWWPRIHGAAEQPRLTWSRIIRRIHDFSTRCATSQNLDSRGLNQALWGQAVIHVARWVQYFFRIHVLVESVTRSWQHDHKRFDDALRSCLHGSRDFDYLVTPALEGERTDIGWLRDRVLKSLDLSIHLRFCVYICAYIVVSQFKKGSYLVRRILAKST